MTLLIHVAGGLLGLFGAFVMGCSWARLAHNLRLRRDSDAGWSSPVPFVGPLFLVVGWTALPVPFPAWALLAFALDPDTVITVVCLPLAAVASLRDRASG